MTWQPHCPPSYGSGVRLPLQPCSPPRPCSPGPGRPGVPCGSLPQVSGRHRWEWQGPALRSSPGRHPPGIRSCKKQPPPPGRSMLPAAGSWRSSASCRLPPRRPKRASGGRTAQPCLRPPPQAQTPWEQTPAPSFCRDPCRASGGDRQTVAESTPKETCASPSPVRH